jgi:hypothetical protein
MESSTLILLKEQFPLYWRLYPLVFVREYGFSMVVLCEVHNWLHNVFSRYTNQMWGSDHLASTFPYCEGIYICWYIKENVCAMEVQDSDDLIKPTRYLLREWLIIITWQWWWIEQQFIYIFVSKLSRQPPEATGLWIILCMCIMEEQKMCCLLSWTRWIIYILTEIFPNPLKRNLQIRR